MILNEATYENYFLLYIDNELTATQKAEVDTFLIHNPSYAPVFESLLASKVTAEHISFENKALLYRFEEMEASIPIDIKQSLYRKQAPIVEISFVQRHLPKILSIAALFILLIGYQVYQNKRNDTLVVLNTNHYIKHSQDPTSKTTLAQLKKELPSSTNKETNSNKEYPATTNSTQVAYQKINRYNAAQTKNGLATLSPIIAGATTSNQKQSNTPIIVTENNSNIIATNNMQAVATLHTSPTVQLNTSSNVTEVTLAETTQQTYDEIETNQSDRIIYISNIEVDSDKLRGITRRMSALFKKNKN
jgi:hypothetical protein